MSNEADTCRTYILPKLHAAGWVDDYISEKQTPTILTTSKMLTTGVNASTCRNVVLFQAINLMVDFKQISA